MGLNNDELINATVLMFTLSENTESYSISGYIGTDSIVVIPSIHRGKAVTRIGVNVFYDCDSLTSIEIPDSVITIDDYAFLDCSSLTNIILPNSLIGIGEYAFALCGSLTSITYDGTKSQWTDIRKESGWDYDIGSYIVSCSDGNI